VLITTLVESASARSEVGSFASASISGSSASVESIAASRARQASSFERLRPAIAHRAPPALAARYSAVRPPVNPVAP
jgi:hypothetical protein